MIPEEELPGRFEWEFRNEQVVYYFDQSVNTHLNDLIVTHLNDGVQVDPAVIQETVNGLGTFEKFTFVDENSDTYLLPNGNYESILRAGGPKNGANEGLGQDRVDQFFVLRGDVNHDRVINGDDYFVIDSNVLQSGNLLGYLNGDFDYNDLINGDDYFHIDGNVLMYGTEMPKPPSAPNTLISYASLGRGRIDVNWTAPANMTGIDGFHVFESVDGVAYTQVAEIADPSARHWFKTGLGDGVKRYYRVRAYDENGNSLATNEAFAVTTLPGPGELTVTPAGPTTLNLNFSDNTDGETTWEIWQSTSGGAYVLVDTFSANAEQGPMVYQRSGLNPGTTYSFRVRAKNAAQTSIFTLHETATTPEVDFGITINNYSFEHAVPNPTTDPVPEWTFSESGDAEVVDPTAFAAPDEINVAHIALTGTMESAGALSQELGDNAQAATIYKLEAWVRPEGASTVWDVELLTAGSELPQSSFNVVNDGAFKKVTVTYTLDDSTTFTTPLVVRLSAGANGSGDVFFDNIRLFRAPLAQTPYNGTPWAVPGVVEFEDFDEGGEGVSWHDTGAGNYGGAYRRNVDSDVDVARDDTGGYYIGWAKEGEWLEYTINVPTAGTFDLTTFVAAPHAGGRFHWEVDGERIGGPTNLNVPDTDNYFNYAPVILSGVSLAAGDHVLRVVLDQAGEPGWTSVGNFNYFTLTNPTGGVAPPTLLDAVTPSVFSSRVDLSWQDNTDNETGYLLQYREANTTPWTSKSLRANTESYALTGLSADTDYQFQIAAVSGAATSTFSDLATTSTLAAIAYPVRVNFQVDRTPPIPGYLMDSGDVFGTRSEGLSYGWNTDHTIQDRQRGINSDRRLDTLVHFRQGGQWSINVPDGTYDVTVGIGDPGWTSTYTVNVNGVSYWNNFLLPKNDPENKTMTLNVSEGNIVIDQGLAPDRATRINYVEITSASNPPPPGTPRVTITPAAANAFEAGELPAVFTVTRTGPTTEPLLVRYNVGGTATSSADYDPLAGVVQIDAGYSIATIGVTPVDDDVPDAGETVALVLAQAEPGDSPYVIESAGNAIATIVDDDVPPTTSGGLTLYRWSVFDKAQPIPDALEDTDGVQLFFNGDDSPRAMAKVTLTKQAGQNAEYRLTRSSMNINIWRNADRTGAVLSQAEGLTSAPINYAGDTLDVWVEWAKEAGTSQTPVELAVESRLIAVPAPPAAPPSWVKIDEGKVKTTGRLIVGLGGHTQQAKGDNDDKGDEGMLDPTSGVQLILNQLAEDYPVQGFAEDPGNDSKWENVAGDDCGEGVDIAFQVILHAVQQWKLKELGLIGYSHGGSSVRLLTHRIDTNKQQFGNEFSIKFTAYIDAVRLPNGEDAGAPGSKWGDIIEYDEEEYRYPHLSPYHVNIFQRRTDPGEEASKSIDLRGGELDPRWAGQGQTQIDDPIGEPTNSFEVNINERTSWVNDPYFYDAQNQLKPTSDDVDETKFAKVEGVDHAEQSGGGPRDDDVPAGRRRAIDDHPVVQNYVIYHLRRAFGENV